MVRPPRSGPSWAWLWPQGAAPGPRPLGRPLGHGLRDTLVAAWVRPIVMVVPHGYRPTTLVQRPHPWQLDLLHHSELRGTKGGSRSSRQRQYSVAASWCRGVAPDFKYKTRCTPYVSPGSQISHIATNKGNINRQCLIYNILSIKDIT